MAVAARVQLRGMKQLQRRLRKLPDRAQRHALRPAVRKASTIVARKARKEAPVGRGDRGSFSVSFSEAVERKPLKKTIKTKVKTYKKTNSVVAIIGPEHRAAPHAHLVHDGTKPHDITLSKPLVVSESSSLGRGSSGRFETVTRTSIVPAGTTFRHPGTKANPFLARAIRATERQVDDKLQTELRKGIEKQANKLAKSR